MGIPELDVGTVKLALYLSDWLHPSDLPFFIPPDSFSPRFGTQFFTVACTGWEIVDRNDGEGKFVVYKFTITRGRQENVVRIRYSQIASFRETLIEIPVIGGEHIEKLPFPGKVYAPWNQFRASVLDARADDINKFFESLFRLNMLLPGLKCIRALFSFESFDTDAWWKETGYGEIRKNTFDTPRIARRFSAGDNPNRKSTRSAKRSR